MNRYMSISADIQEGKGKRSKYLMGKWENVPKKIDTDRVYNWRNVSS